jgi:hypothetical protein
VSQGDTQSSAYGRPRWHGLLHGRSGDLAWAAGGSIAGITAHPDANWMSQVARNATLEELGYLHGCRYVLQDRDAKFCAKFR